MDPATIALLLSIAKVTAPLIADGSTKVVDLFRRWRSESVITEEQSVLLMQAARTEMQSALDELDAELGLQPDK